MISFNTILLCLDGILNDESQLNIIENCNVAITYVFLFEMVIKLIALGIKSIYLNFLIH